MTFAKTATTVRGGKMLRQQGKDIHNRYDKYALRQKTDSGRGERRGRSRSRGSAKGEGRGRGPRRRRPRARPR